MRISRILGCSAVALALLGFSPTAADAREPKPRPKRVQRVNRPAKPVAMPKGPRRPERVPAALANAHRENVKTSVERLLSSNVLTPEQEYWTRAGLAKFLAAPRGAQGLVNSGWDGDSSSLERNVELESSQRPANLQGMQPTTDAAVIALGRLTCFFGDTLLLGGRFLVQATWSNPFNGTAGVAFACALTPTSGYFFFGLDRSNVEVPIKILNGCLTANPGHWVFAAGLTNLGVQLTVIDGFTGSSRTYNNAPGSNFELILDQRTPFPCP